VVNVFTPGVSGKRPVMVWLHAAAFAEARARRTLSTGNYLAARGTWVVVTVNHRSTSSGYLYLGGVAAKSILISGNAGVLDIIAALQWTPETSRISRDPGNVTVFGQSGGARSEHASGNAARKGLIHKAIIESGSALKGSEPGKRE